MKAKATFEELQQRIRQLSEEVRTSNIDFLSVSPKDKDYEVLNFDKKEKPVHNYVTDWEIG